MGRPRKRPDRLATPERILDAAREVFGREGFERATLAEIARGAQITRPSLLYHFASKEALYGAVVRRAFGRVTVALAVGMEESGPFATRLSKVAEAFASYLAANPTDAQIVVREMSSPDGPGRVLLLEQVGPLLDRVATFVESEGQGALRPGLPIRQAVLQVAADVLLANASSDAVRDALWGPPSPERTAWLARALILAEET